MATPEFRKSVSATLAFPSKEKAMGVGTMFNFIHSSFDLSGSKSRIVRQSDKGTIILPLPQNLTEITGLSYEGTELGLLGAAAQGGINLAKQIEQSGASGVAESILKGTAAGAGYWARSAAQSIGSLGTLLNLRSGEIPNPFMTTTFRGVAPRTHNLTWKLTPLTEKDSTTIRNIIEAFKVNALPGRDGLFLTMPSEVEVWFFGTEYLYGMSRCVIENIQVNYAPNNVPSLFAKTNAPTTVELTLVLREIEVLTRDSFKTGVGKDERSTFSPEALSTLPSKPLNQGGGKGGQDAESKAAERAIVAANSPANRGGT